MSASLSPNRFLFRRPDADLTGWTPQEVAGYIYFTMWQTRQSPFAILSEGDALYWWDIKSGRLTWELRVREPIKAAYDCYHDVYRMLRQAYGADPESLNLSEYVWNRPLSGWLLAFAVDAIGEIDIPVPAGLKAGPLGARNGFVPWDRIPTHLRDSLERQLPPLGRRARAVASPEVSAVRAMEGREPPPVLDRSIPLEIRRRVFQRDGGQCRSCGRRDDEVELHIDHIYPWSRGGPNLEENLQLLCRDCNLAKGSRIDPDQPVPLQLVSRETAKAAEQQWRKLWEELASPEPMRRGRAAIELALRTPNPDEAMQLLQVARDSPEDLVADRATAELAYLTAATDERAAATLAEEALRSEHRDPHELAAAILAHLNSARDPHRSEELARIALASEGARTVAMGADTLMRLLPLDHEDMAGVLEAAHEAGDSNLRARAALLLSFFTQEVTLGIELLGEAMGSPNGQVAASAAIELAIMYEELGERETAAKLATDALRVGGDDVVPDARELLERVGGDGPSGVPGSG